jgi:multidrug efflux pump subunit AcrA (membrane-fusion protein)
MARLREGAAAALVGWDGSGGTVAGRVRVIYPEVDRATRLGKIRIALGKDPSLRIGSFARGTVEVARHTGAAVPLASVVYGAGGVATVLVVAGDRVQARQVRTGLSSDGFVEVLEQLRPGELVVARAGSFLRDGDVVRAVVAGGAIAQAGSEKGSR